MDYIKTESDIEKMRIAGKLASQVLEMVEEYVKPGVSTLKLDQICHDYIVKRQDAIPAPLNYKGFPKSICTSVNHQVCHGIPSDEKILKKGEDYIIKKENLKKLNYQNTWNNVNQNLLEILNEN